MDAKTRLHLGLTRDRELVGRRYLDDPELLAAYEEHFSPMSYAKAHAVLREVAKEPRVVIDVGAGPGAMARAARDLYPQARVIACDRSARALGRIPDGIERVVWDLVSPQPNLPRADVVLMGNLLNELEGDPARHLERVAALLAEDGLLVIIEPALRETARPLEQARDRLIEKGWFVVAPCLWRGNCPALERERDWCHEDRSDDETLKFAYLVLRRHGQWSTDDCQFRVVSAKMAEKGREKLWGCGPRGRFLIVRLDKHASPANQAWERIRRGDVVELSGLEARGSELRVTADTRVRVLFPVVV